MSEVTLDELDTSVEGDAPVTMDDLGPAMDAPNNSVFHEPTGRVLDLPQGMDARETQYTIDKDVDGKKGFYGQVHVGELPPIDPALLPEIPKPMDLRGSWAGILARSLGRGGTLAGREMVAQTQLTRAARMKAGKTTAYEQTYPGIEINPAYQLVKFFMDEDTPEEKAAVIDAGVRMEEKAQASLKSLRDDVKRYGFDTTADETDTFKKILAGVGESSAEYSVVAGLSFLTRNPVPATAYFYTKQRGASFEEAYAKTGDVDKSERIATEVAIPVSALDIIGLGNAFKAAKGAGVFTRIWDGIKHEFPTEGVQSLWESGVTNVEGIRNDTLGQVFESAFIEAAAGGVVGAGANVAFGQRIAQSALDQGAPEDIAVRMGRLGKKYEPAFYDAMGDFIEREVSPLSSSDESAKQFMQLMQRFDAGKPVREGTVFTPEEEEVFKKWVEIFDKSTPDDRSSDAVEAVWFKMATSKGLDTEQAVTSAKLIGAFSKFAGNALGIRPMDWYESNNLDLEVQRTPEQAVSAYKEKLDALKLDLPDAPLPERVAPQPTAEDEAIKAEEIAGFEKRLSDARGSTKDVGMKKPIINYLKGLGGIRTDGLIYSELRHLGIDRKTAFGLFNNKDTALRDIDNIPVEEFNRALGVSAQDDGNGYVDRDWLLEALRDEQFGKRMGQEKPAVDDSFIQALDKAGLDYRTATAEQVYEALGADADIVTAAADMGVELMPKEVRQIRAIMDTDPAMDVRDAIDEFAERSAIMGDRLFQRDGNQAVIPGAEKATDKQVAEKGMEGRMKATKAQKPMDEGMFGDGFKQGTLFQRYERLDLLQRMFENDLRDRLETLMGYKGEAHAAKRDAFVERARTGTLTEADLALKKEVVDAAKRVGGKMFQGNFSGPLFFSALQRNIETLNQPKGSPEQWAGIIRNLTQKGVKQEEIDWTGVLDWIQEQNGSVTKEQVLDYLNANKIEVSEVIRGSKEQQSLEAAEKAFIDAAVQYDDMRERDAKDMAIDVVRGDITENQRRLMSPQMAQAADALAAAYNARKNAPPVKPTKFDKYTIPGGENYRELLMTLPPRGEIIYSEDNLRILSESEALADGFSQDAISRYWLVKSPDNVFQITKSKYKTPEMAISYIIREKQPEAPADKNYKSSHYDEKNILAHIRFNERTATDGKRVMFIEEIQSDWHQAGRDKGYKQTPRDTTGWTAEKQPSGRWAVKDADGTWMSNYYADSAAEAIEAAAEARPDSRVPDAPFKTTWPELAFKRALMWAVENNFDRVAWTTGEQQAERYDLSKEISSIDYEVNPDNTYKVAILGKDGREIEQFSKEDYSETDLADVVGKEIVAKMKAKEGRRSTYDDGEFYSLSGLDLKVGGEGMKGFYDKMLPSMVNKLVKKWGGKVGTTSLEAGKFTKADDELLAALNDTASTQEGDKAINKGVWSLDITPAMRESVMQGLPLFQEGARGSITFGKNRTLIQLFQDANPSTLLHELGHLFLRDMRSVAAGSRRPQIKKDFEIIKQWLGSKDGKFTEEQEEKFARGFEAYLREGKAPVEGLQGVFDRFKAWLTGIYKSAKDLNVEINDDVRQVFDRMLGAEYSKAESAVKERGQDKLAKDYEAVKAPPPPSLRGDTGDILASAGQLVSNIFTPISSRLGRIDPKLKAAVRKYTFNTGMAEQRDRERVVPFLNAVEKMTDEDYRMLDFALKNRDNAMVDQMVDKYGMRKEFGAVRELLDDIYNTALEVGLDVAYLDDYFPRMVKLNKATDYMSQLRGRPDWSLIQEALAAEDPMNQFTDEEKAVFVNKWLRGFTPAGTQLSKPSFTKERVIDYVEPQNNHFYLESGEALLKYISAMRLGIAQREIFGKGQTSDESIGAYVANLVESGAIDYTQENEVKLVMQALLNAKGPGIFVSWLKNAGYVYLMGSPISALTQIGDLAFSLAKNGYYNTGVSLTKAIVGKSVLKKEDLGIDNIAQEFEDKTRSSEAVRKVFKVVGLSWMDNIGKQTFIESSYKRLREEAKKNSSAYQKKMDIIFGDEAASVRQDLLDGTLSDNVKLLLYSEMSDVQPVSLAEMPVGYLRGGNWRSLYMLKTYTIKQLDIYRTEIFDKMASGEAAQVKEGTVMMIRLATALMLTGMGADALKDLILGRAMTLSDTFMDNLIKLSGLTKFQIYKSRRDGVGNTLAQMMFIPPLYAPFDNLIKDVQDISSGKIKAKDAQSLNYVPVVGKFYYWWVGGGRAKEDKKQGKKNEK